MGSFDMEYVEKLMNEKKYQEAFDYCIEFANDGDAEAQTRIGVFYYNGTGVEINYKKAFEWYTKGAELGNAPAMSHLGACYITGIGVAKDIKIAADWYTKAAELGNAQAMYNLGVCYDNGTGVAKDETIAVEWYSKAAELGNALAMYSLGVCYDNGTGVAKDETIAVEWYAKAAKLGEARAMCNLGVCYEYGRGVAKDEKKAVEWYTKAAELGYARAMCNLGVCFDNGTGVAKDETVAVEWYAKAAELGNTQAMRYLGVCYKNGSGVSNDKAKQEHTKAPIYAANFLSDGTGTETNEEQAAHWYIKAAEAGDVEALFEAGQCYEYGTGVEEDDVKAVSFYRRAVEKGHKDAAKHLHKLERSMTLNSELEEQINKLTEQLREKERESEARNQDSMILQKIMSNVDSIMSDVGSIRSHITTTGDDTHRKVVEILDITKETNVNVKSLTDYIKNELPSKIASLRAVFGVDTISESELTEADEKKIGEFCKTVRAVIEKQFDEKNDLIRQSRKNLSNRFGNVWGRLCQETQNSLVSSMTLWKAYKNIDDANFDFSGICILATSALENELRKIFFEEFQEFVKNQTGGKINRYPSILTYRKGTELVAGKSEYFALGKMPFLFGQTGKDPSSEDLSDIKRLNDFREKYLESIIDSQKMIDSGFASFSECFTKPFFSKNSELKKEKNFHVYYKGSLISEFEDIRNKYRNKSAHQGGLRRDEAHDCCNLVFGSSIMGDNDLEQVLGLIQKVYYLLKQ